MRNDYGFALMIGENKKGKKLGIKIVSSRIYVWIFPVFIKIVLIY